MYTCTRPFAEISSLKVMKYNSYSLPPFSQNFNRVLGAKRPKEQAFLKSRATLKFTKMAFTRMSNSPPCIPSVLNDFPEVTFKYLLQLIIHALPPEIRKISLFSRGGLHPVQCNRHFENSRLNEC